VALTRINPVLPTARPGQKIIEPVYIYEVAVDPTGRVTDLNLVKGMPDREPYRAIDKAFRQAIISTPYKPASENGRPVPFRLTVSAWVEVR
jgi:hypothetical protein